MPLTHDDLCRIAHLASLPAPGREDDPVVRDLQRMLELVGELPEIAAGGPPDGVEEAAVEVGDGVGAPQGGAARLPVDSVPVDLVLANAPAAGGDLLLVPRVLRPAGDREER